MTPLRQRQLDALVDGEPLADRVSIWTLRPGMKIRVGDEWLVVSGHPRSTVHRGRRVVTVECGSTDVTVNLAVVHPALGAVMLMVEVQR